MKKLSFFHTPFSAYLLLYKLVHRCCFVSFALLAYRPGKILFMDCIREDSYIPVVQQ